MKKYIFLCFALFIFLQNNILAQSTDSINVVYLKTGKVVRGHIIEMNPNIEIKFKTLDGSIIIYSYDDFIKLGNEKNTYINKIKHEKIIYEKEKFILGGIASHSSQSSGFVMAGIVKNYGGFLKVKTNFNFNSSFADEGYSYFSNRYFNDNIYTGRFAITSGILWRVTKPIILYGGLGYGNRWVNWETISGQRYRVYDISHKGFELETGLLYQINKIFFTGGVSTIPFQYMELNFGFGIKLK